MKNKISFKEDTHQYINTENNIEYLSVSRLLALYKDKFDAQKISFYVSKKRGISQQEVLDEWEANKNYACDRGTEFHLALENNIKYGEIDSNYKKVIEDFQLCISKSIKDIENIQSEVLFYNDEFEIAGTSDICFEHSDNTFTIGDFKTNKNFRYKSEYKKWLKSPVSHLAECEYNVYTLQLSIYAFMYEVLTGKKCSGILLLWLNKDTGKWEPIRANYMKHEVIMILQDYKRNKNNKYGQ